MAIVSDIQDALKAQVATLLGADWHELTHRHVLEKNADRIRSNGYGVLALGAFSVSGVTNYYTVQHTFEVILTGTIPSSVDDSDRETVLKTLFDKADIIFKNTLGGKLSLPATILVINNPEISQPEIFETEAFVALRFRMDVTYRSGALV